MTEPLHLVGIVGSLRSESINRAVFNTAVSLIGSGVELSEASLTEVPLYNGDVEDAGDPPSVVALKQAVDTADALIVFTPEYNRGVPAVTKNAIDWLSRPNGGRVLASATVGVVAATPGGHDVPGVRSHLADSIGDNALNTYETSLGLGSIHSVTDAQIDDEVARQQLAEWLEGFVAYVKNL